MRAGEDLISDDELAGFPGPFVIWTRKGWGHENWFVIRKSDRKVMTQGGVRKCCRWVGQFGRENP